MRLAELDSWNSKGGHPAGYGDSMLIIAGEFRMQPGTRDRFLEAVAPMVAATREEPGCQAYAFTPDPDAGDLIRLWELWDDEDALAGHFASAHMAAWRKRSADLPVTSREINKYTVSDVSPLG
jgi:quinol monooxygenase YgiN